MKRNILRNVVAAAAVCATVFVAPSGAGEQQRGGGLIQIAPADKNTERMKALERALEESVRENAILKRRVKELEVQVEKLRDSRGVNILPGPLRMPDNKVPPDWKPFEFNGVTYYIVPCEAAQRGSGNLRRGTEWNDLLSGREGEVRSGTYYVKPTPKVDERPAK